MIHHTLAGLIPIALDTGLIEKDDIDYARNQAMHLLQLDAFPEEAVAPTDDTIPNL